MRCTPEIIVVIKIKLIVFSSHDPVLHSLEFVSLLFRQKTVLHPLEKCLQTPMNINRVYVTLQVVELHRPMGRSNPLPWQIEYCIKQSRFEYKL